ncbi:unnamed protein product, partial [Protopolystoma xenopodis]
MDPDSRFVAPVDLLAGLSATSLPHETRLGGRSKPSQSQVLRCDHRYLSKPNEPERRHTDTQGCVGLDAGPATRQLGNGCPPKVRSFDVSRVGDGYSTTVSNLAALRIRRQYGQRFRSGRREHLRLGNKDGKMATVANEEAKLEEREKLPEREEREKGGKKKSLEDEAAEEGDEENRKQEDEYREEEEEENGVD